MTSKEENETIILINDSDLEHGYFDIGTSNYRIADSIQDKFKGHILDEQNTIGPNKQITWWQFQIDKSALPKAPFIAPRQKRSLSDSQRQQLAQRLQKANTIKASRKKPF